MILILNNGKVENVSPERLSADKRRDLLRSERAKFSSQPAACVMPNTPKPIFCVSCVAYTVERKDQLCEACVEKQKNNEISREWRVMRSLLFFAAALAAGGFLVIHLFWRFFRATK